MNLGVGSFRPSRMAVWEELYPTAILDPYQSGPKADHPTSPRITWGLASAQGDQGVEEGTHEETTGLSPLVEARSSIKSAGWK